MTSALKRFAGLPPRRRRLLIEAVVCLVGARAAGRLLSSRQLARFLNRPMPHQPELTGPAREQIREDVGWAVDCAAGRLPGRTLCLPRGIAAHVMARRRRIATTVYYGIATAAEGGLAAHVWVQDGPNGIVGHGVANQYQVLARYGGPGPVH